MVNTNSFRKPSVQAPPAQKAKVPPQPRTQQTVRPRMATPRPPRLRNTAVEKADLIRPASSNPDESPSDRFHDAYNQYWNTLRCAEQVHGVKIPDIDFQASGTLTTVEKTTITTSSNGVASLMWGGSGVGTQVWSIPTYSACALGNNATYTFVSGVKSNTATASSAPFSVAGTTAGVVPWQWSAITAAGTTGSTATGPLYTTAHDPGWFLQQ